MTSLRLRVISVSTLLLSGTVVSAKLASAGISQIPSYFAVLAIAIVPVILIHIDTSDIARAMLIYAASLATLWHSTLVTSHLWGWDIHYMLHVSRIVSQIGEIPLQTNAGHGSMVAITWLVTMIAEITGLDLVIVYKWVVPLAVAGIAVVLFAVARHLDVSSSATLGPFAFIFFYRFFKTIPGKQPTAQLLFVTILFLIPIARKSYRRASFAMTVLGAGLVTAHHSTSLVALLFAIGALGTIFILDLLPIDREPSPSQPVRVFGIIGLFWVIWYLRILSGDLILSAITAASFSIQQISDTVTGILGTGGGAPSGSGGARTGAGYLDIIFQEPILFISALLVFLVIGAGTLGIIAYLVDTLLGHDTDDLLLGFGVAAVGFGVVGIIASVGMGFDRVVSYVLLVLAPFVALLPRAGKRVGNVLDITVSPSDIRCGLAILIALMFVFGSGLAYVAVGEQPPSYAVGVEADSYWQTYEQDEVAAVAWMSTHFETTAAYLPSGPIKQRDGLLLVERYYPDEITRISPTEEGAKCKSFFHTERPWRSGSGPDGWLVPESTAFYNTTLSNKPIIYDSGKGTVYRC